MRSRPPAPPLPPPAIEGQWNVPLLALVIYIVFVPLTLCSALHWTVVALMWLAGMAVALMESISWVDRRVELLEDESSRNPLKLRVVMRDMFWVLRLLCTTVGPILLASFQGASFVVTATQLGSTVQNCSVSQLPQLSAAGVTLFRCIDGYIAVDLQMGVPAWGQLKGQTSSLMVAPAAVRAQEASTDGKRTVGYSKDHRFGFTAPIFRSHAAFARGEGPVAWAVKAGSPVKRSVCAFNMNMPGTCGFMAEQLQEHWKRYFIAPKWFGMTWGFNITHFSRSEMLAAVQAVRGRFASTNLTGPTTPTFVVAEDYQEYFGLAYPLLWVTGTLLLIGFLDRLVTVLDGVPNWAEEEDNYTKMVANLELSRPGTDRSILDEAAGFWNDSLGRVRGGPDLETFHKETSDVGLSTQPSLSSRSSPYLSARPATAFRAHGPVPPLIAGVRTVQPARYY